MIRNEDLFYCYSKKLSTYIYKQSGIVPLTIAINPNNNRMFSLYGKSIELQAVLNQYKKENEK